jgi:drug/metabolite transporter (DMT)-like permease
MPFGLLTGLGAALSWGTMDIASALSSRLIGSLRVTAAVQLICAGFLVAATIVTGTSIPSDLTTLSMAALLGVIGAGAYFAYFTGLRIGPISVVSGMVAAYGGLTVVLSVAFRGESLTLTQAVGAAVATGGVILTGVSFGGSLRATRFAGPGVVFAVVALVLFALMAITMDVALEAADWLQVLLVSRLVIGLVCIVGIVWVAITRGRAAPAASRAEGTATDPPEEPGPLGPVPIWRVAILLIVAGALDATGLMSFAIGLSNAPTWLVGLASSFGPAVTILVAVAFLGERLKAIQWLGLVGVAIGMVAIGLP